MSHLPFRLTRCRVIIPFYGRWPLWMELFLASCHRNPTIDWVIVTDNTPPPGVPANVVIEHVEWEDLVRTIRRICRLAVGPQKPYRLCDFRFAYGDIFRSLLGGYDFWGFGDMDVIYGDLRAFLTEPLFAHDLLTFNATHVSGHFTLLRNCDEVVSRYREDKVWRERVERPQAQMLDEANGYYGLENVYAVESFNTPLSPHIPWTHGRFEFPAVWYYCDGALTTNVDGDRRFMYLHFMRYKSRWQGLSRAELVRFSNRDGDIAWKLKLDGFGPYDDVDKSREAGQYLCVVPVNAADKILS